MNDKLCQDHSGVCTQLGHLEDNVSKLWRKWDSMQKLLLCSLVAAVCNLLGILTVLVVK